MVVASLEHLPRPCRLSFCEKVMSRLEVPQNREDLKLLELPRKGLDAAMPAGRGAGADGNGRRCSFLAFCKELAYVVPVSPLFGFVDYGERS